MKPCVNCDWRRLSAIKNGWRTTSPTALIAQWAKHADCFDDMWEATRPADPSTETWDHLWSAVSARLDNSPVPVAKTPSLRTRPVTPSTEAAELRRSRRFPVWRGAAAIGLVGLAQAAALLLAVNLYWNSTPGVAPAPEPDPVLQVVQQTPVPILDPVVDVEAGQVVLIRSEGSTVKILDLSLSEAPNGEDPWYVFFNRVESASTVVAMTE